MTTKAQRVRIGVFTLATGVLAAITLIAFGGVRFWEHRDRYTIVIDGSVYGLQEGAQVFANGIRVGSVEDLTVPQDDPSKVVVTIKIKAGTPVRTDTRAMLQVAGITGLKVIDLRGGSLAAPPLPPGAAIAQGDTTLDMLEKRAQSIVDQSDRLLTRANQVMDNLATATDPRQLDGIMAQARAASANLAHAAAALDATIGENRVALRQTIASIGASAKTAQDVIDGQLSLLLTNANDTVSDFKGIVRDSQLRAALADLRQASRSLKELSREVRQKPSRLLFSGTPKDRKLP